MQESVKVGDRFPVSELVASDGQRVDLGSLTGPAVVYFYPADGTSTCTLEAVEFNRAFDDYAAANVALVGVSVDDDESHRCFAEDQSIRFTLLLDRDAIVRATWAPEEQDLADHPAQALEAARALEAS